MKIIKSLLLQSKLGGTEMLNKQLLTVPIKTGRYSRFTLIPDALFSTRELKQTDAAAERRRSTSNFLFRRNQGQVNSLGP